LQRIIAALRSARARLALTVVTAITSGCHVTTSTPDTRRGERRIERAPDLDPRKLPPSLDLDPDGRFRFVEPYVCTMHTVTELATFDVERTRPNLATLAVGVIVTAVGAVAAVSGVSADDPFGSPATYAGVAGLGVGLPFVIGPLIGNGVAHVPRDVSELRTAASEEACGTRPLAATRATITWSGLRVTGAIDADGYFEVSPFAFIDAFDVGRIPALVLAIEVTRDDGPMPMEVVLEAAALAEARAGYFARTRIDAAVEQLRKVPRFESGMLRVSRVKRDGARGLRVAMTLSNVGPGDAYGVRLAVTAPHPELDGRLIYIGRLASKSLVEVDTVIPVSEDADRALGGELDLAVMIRDAHGTAPSSPVRFRGTVLHDPRP
jgi:hypothetical protein